MKLQKVGQRKEQPLFLAKEGRENPGDKYPSHLEVFWSQLASEKSLRVFSTLFLGEIKLVASNQLWSEYVLD